MPEVGTLCGHGQPLFWGDAAQCHVWAFVIVGPHPLRGSLLNMVQIVPVVLGEPFVSGRPVEPFDVGVLLRLAGLDVFKPDAPP